MKEYISKKDLLKETGISYGQLYRWKREKLIPEEWFEKQSSVTGQETYFPKEQVLRRVKRIQELKDSYSLEELAKLLSPEISNRLFSEEDIEVFQEIDIELAASFMDILEKDEFSFHEVLVMMACSKCKQEFAISDEEMLFLIKGIASSMRKLPSIAYRFLVIVLDTHYYGCFCIDHQEVLLDERFQVLKSMSLQDLSNEVKTKYRDAFHFAFD